MTDAHFDPNTMKYDVIIYTYTLCAHIASL